MLTLATSTDTNVGIVHMRAIRGFPNRRNAVKFRREFVGSLVAAVLMSLPFTMATSLRVMAQAAEPSQTNGKVLVKEGTEVKLKLAERLSSKNVAEGDLVNFVLDKDLRIGDVTVARAGAVAVGTISHASRSGILGRPGDLAVRLEYLRTPDSQLELRGSKGNQGKGRECTTVVLTVLFGPVGLAKHGRNAEFSQGTSLTAFVDRDTELSAVE
jgi:hypothetical protein